jgi:hypothetical protein
MTRPLRFRQPEGADPASLCAAARPIRVISRY